MSNLPHCRIPGLCIILPRAIKCHRSYFLIDIMAKSPTELENNSCPLLVATLPNKLLDTANISKFSDSENAPKNLENMCNYASIFRY